MPLYKPHKPTFLTTFLRNCPPANAQHPPASPPRQPLRARTPPLHAQHPPASPLRSAPQGFHPQAHPSKLPASGDPSCVRFSSLLASVKLAVRGIVLRRATPSCPFVLPDSVKHASLLTPLAFAFGFRAWSARAPFGVPARAVRPLRARALSAPLRSPASSALLRPPALSGTLHVQKTGLRACGASAIGAPPLKGGRPRSPFAPLARPFGALRLHSLFGLRGLCRAVCGWGVSGGVSGGDVEGATRLINTPARLALERDFTLTLP